MLHDIYFQSIGIVLSILSSILCYFSKQKEEELLAKRLNKNKTSKTHPLGGGSEHSQIQCAPPCDKPTHSNIEALKAVSRKGSYNSFIKGYVVLEYETSI